MKPKALAALFLALSPLPACSGAPAGTPPSSAPTTVASSQSPTDPNVPAGIPGDLGRPFQTSEWTNQRTGNRYRLDLYPLRKKGDTTRLFAKLTVDPANKSGDTNSWLLSGEGTHDSVYTVPSGFTLLDVEARERIQPSLFREGDPSSCTPTISGMNPGDMAWITCAFATPQSAKVDVVTRNFGIFARVPVVEATLPASVPSPVPTRDGVLGPRYDVANVLPRRFPLPLAVVDASGISAVDERPTQITTTLNANVAFAKDSAELRPEAVARLQEIAADLATKQPGPIAILGFTDNLGTHEHGVELSQARAKAVRAVLEPQLAGFTLTDEGRAEAEPVAPNDSEANRAKNRRVEIRYTGTAAAGATPRTPAPKTADQAQPIAKEVTGDSHRRYRLSADHVTDRGGFLQLDLTVEMLGQEPSGMGDARILADTQLAGSSMLSHTDGVSLVNPQTKERHVAGFDAKGGLCTPGDLSSLGAKDTDRVVTVHCFFAPTHASQLEVHTVADGLIGTLPVR